MSVEAKAAQPIGPVVDTARAAMPGAVTIEGRYGTVEKLNPVKHMNDLWNALGHDDSVWTYLFYGPFQDAGTFLNFLGKIADLQDQAYYAILDKNGRAQGWASLMRIEPVSRVIEVGSIAYGPAMQRTPLATEAQFLLMRYAFETLGYRRYEWKCDALNAPSRRAAERFGFGFEGLFRQHMIVKGHSRDTAWFSIIDNEWSRVKQAFELWLDDKNFEGGRQRRSLTDIRNSL